MTGFLPCGGKKDGDGDMSIRILLKANLKRHRGGLFGIFLLTLLAAAALGTVLTVWSNSSVYIKSEIKRAGFGELTAWVSGVPDTEGLAEDIGELSEIGRVETQSLIFSNYEVNGQESDSEGQLITFDPQDGRYRFFLDDFSGYRSEAPEILPGEIYVSPSMVSMFGVRTGERIVFPVARAGKNVSFTVKGFYEDPFMGSTMIGMKGFLICETDRDGILDILKDTGIDALARDGAMLHIFPASSYRTISELNSIINENTQLPAFAESVHSRDAIAGFMLILQNAFGGLLLAFAAVLLFVVMAVLGHSIGSAVESDYVNMGILKTVGYTSADLQKIQLLQYLVGLISGMVCGLLLSIPFSGLVSSATLTTTGILMPVGLPLAWILFSFVMILLLLTGFIVCRTGKIRKITPMKAIRGETEGAGGRAGKSVPAFGRGIYFRLALRQLISGKRRYAGAMAVAALLVFFASLAGRMDTWLGPDGKGMMDAFNPADHDIGVQVFGNLTADEAERIVRSYTDITDMYLLAMPGVSVNGVDYTANVISEPERFHILAGRTCIAEDEIVLTEFVAGDFGISIGDRVTVRGDRGSGEYVISGIYSCANDMGGNVGMSREGYLRIGSDNPHIWCWHYFLADTSQKTVITERLETAYGGDVHVHENTWPGLFGIISAMQALMVFMYSMIVFFILIVTVMAGSKILQAEQKDLASYKAIGFRTNMLRLVFAFRFGMTAVIGSIIGTALAAVLTDPLVSAMMKLAGISNFVSAASVKTVLVPAGIVILLFTGFAYLAAGRMKKMDLSILISSQ